MDKKEAGEKAGRAAERDDTRRVKELTLLYDVSRILDQSLDMREIVSPVLEALAESMDMNFGTLTLLNRKTGDIWIEAAHGLSPQQARRGRYKLGEGVTGQVILTGEPIVIPRKSESPLILDKTRREAMTARIPELSGLNI